MEQIKDMLGDDVVNTILNMKYGLEHRTKLRNCFKELSINRGGKFYLTLVKKGDHLKKFRGERYDMYPVNVDEDIYYRLFYDEAKGEDRFNWDESCSDEISYSTGLVDLKINHETWTYKSETWELTKFYDEEMGIFKYLNLHNYDSGLNAY